MKFKTEKKKNGMKEFKSFDKMIEVFCTTTL